jgi:hypothetical protein
MALPFLKIATALADLVPSLTKWFGPEHKSTDDRTRKIVNQVIEVAKRVTQTDDAATALSMLQANPKALLEFQAKISEIERDLERAFLSDRASARVRDMALINTGRQNTRADIMVISAAVGLMGCLIAIAYFKQSLPGEAVGIISTIAGIFGSCLKDAYSFEFGSSRGSKAKDYAAFLKDH